MYICTLTFLLGLLCFSALALCSKSLCFFLQVTVVGDFSPHNVFLVDQGTSSLSLINIKQTTPGVEKDNLLSHCRTNGPSGYGQTGK